MLDFNDVHNLLFSLSTDAILAARSAKLWHIELRAELLFITAWLAKGVLQLK